MKIARKKKVFISYAREDMEEALKVKTFLELNGVATWFDMNDSVPGGIWRHRARKAIKENNYFIALLSVNSVERNGGYVWQEFELALIKQRRFPDHRPYIFPVLLNIPDESIPEEFVAFNCVRLSETSLENILHVIENDPVWNVGWIKRIAVLSLIICFLAATLFFIASWQSDVALLFKSTIRDEATNEPVQDAYAYILGPNNDTIIKSPPSGSNGQVSFVLDTTKEIQATVWYYRPGYKNISKSYRLMAHDTYRSVKLQKEEDSMVIIPSIPVSVRSFLLTGLGLTETEKKKIKTQTGYTFSYADTAERISVDYDHTSFTSSPVTGKVIFQGSPVFLIRNTTKINTGIFFPSDGNSPRNKEDIEQDNEPAFRQLISSKRKEIIDTLITFLKSYH